MVIDDILSTVLWYRERIYGSAVPRYWIPIVSYGQRGERLVTGSPGDWNYVE